MSCSIWNVECCVVTFGCWDSVHCGINTVDHCWTCCECTEVFMLINDGRNPDWVREVFVQLKKFNFKIPSPPWVMFYVLIGQLRGQNAFTQKQQFSRYCIFYFTELSYTHKTYKFFNMFQVDLQNDLDRSHCVALVLQVSDLSFLRASAEVKHIIKCNTCFKACVKTYKYISSTWVNLSYNLHYNNSNNIKQQCESEEMWRNEMNGWIWLILNQRS